MRFNVRKMLSPKRIGYIDKNLIQMREWRHMRFLSYLILVGDDIFRTLERIESNQPYYSIQPLHIQSP